MQLSMNTRLYAGAVFITMATVESGGLFLIRLLKKNNPFTSFQTAFFRAGHAHAGVFTILFCVAQLYIDSLTLQYPIQEHLLRIGFGLAPILIPGGFFAAASGKGLTAPNKWICLIYAGAIILAISLISLGILLIRSAVG
ncbi:MAG: hypothetical protein JST75_22125 [Bacteroidetes bacterium]|nr:hypothetical protein [Bacteroidota bacterium]